MLHLLLSIGTLPLPCGGSAELLPNVASTLTNHDATETLISILDTSEGITTIFTSEKTFLNGHITGGKLILLPDKGTAIGSSRVAAPFLELISNRVLIFLKNNSHVFIVADSAVVYRGKGGILEHTQDIRSTTSFRLVPRARVITGRINDHTRKTCWEC
jgi:hypothetical protein